MSSVLLLYINYIRESEMSQKSKVFFKICFFFSEAFLNGKKLPTSFYKVYLSLSSDL